jgi:CubicO group peptidase (beta-lactamase class C family)
MMWRRVVKAMGNAPRRGVAAVALMAALLSGPAMTLAQDATPELHPFVPEKTPDKTPEKTVEKAPEPRQEAPAAAPASASSSSSASAAPKRLKPKVPRPATPLLPGQATPAVTPAATQPASAAARPAVPAAQNPAAAQPQPQQTRPVVTAPVAPPPQPGLPATFPTVNGAPPPAVTVATNPSLVSAQPVNAATPRNPATPVSADDIETYTDSVVRTLMQRDHVMGVTVAVVQGNTPILVKGYGYDRLSPTRRVDPNNSLFRLGSISKVFTWIVARQEIEAGRIKPDAPIAKYVPNDIFSDNGPFKPLTLRDLMDHTGGFEDTSLGHLFVLNPSRIPGTDSYLRHRQPHRQRDPGQFSSYSNFGPELAARALTQTAQARDVPSLMEARVFQPLGMDHTSLREPYAVANPEVDGLPQPLSGVLTQDLSDGFVWDGATYEAQPFDHVIPMSGALGASSTAKDMARFMELMLGNGVLDGVQLFNADSARAFRTPMLAMPEGYNGWASGLMIRTAPSGYVTYGHGGSTLWFNSNMVIVPELNLGIFISTNTQTGENLANAYPNLLLDHLSGDLVRPPLMPTPDQAYANHKDYYDGLRGQYVSTRRAYGGLEGAITRLINTVVVNVDRDGRLILTTRNGLSAYVPAQAQGFFNQQDSEDPGPASTTGGLHFLMKNGKASAFETATNLARYERVGWWMSPDTAKILTIITLITCGLTFLSLFRGVDRHYRPTEEQARASIISAGIAAVWIIAILVFHTWLSNLDDASTLFVKWPAGQVQFASALACLATLGTIYQIVTYYFVYNERMRYGDGWSEWQKYAHAALLIWWAVYAVVIALWGGLAWWSQ